MAGSFYVRLSSKGPGPATITGAFLGLSSPDDKGHDFVGAIVGVFLVIVGAYFLGRPETVNGTILFGMTLGILGGFLGGFFDVDAEAGHLDRSAGGVIRANARAVVGGILSDFMEVDSVTGRLYRSARRIIRGVVGGIVGTILVALDVI